MNKSFVNYVGSVVVGLAVLAGQPYVRGDEPVRVTDSAIDNLTQSEVNALLRRSSVEDILREELDSGRISRVVYNTSNRRSNFRELVYQENVLPMNNRRPVLMLVADADGRGPFTNEQYVFDKTAAIVFKNNTRRFGNVSFAFYDPSIAPDYRVEGGAELRGEGVSRVPSQVLYCPWDFTAGETPDRNSGVVKKLDILCGNPLPSTVIPAMSNSVKWINSNLVRNGSFVWRANNTSPTVWSRSNY